VISRESLESISCALLICRTDIAEESLNAAAATARLYLTTDYLTIHQLAIVFSRRKGKLQGRKK